MRDRLLVRISRRYCTSTVMVLVAVAEPDAPVMVMMYCPDVVPALPPPPPPPPLWPPPPQDTAGPATNTRSASRPSRLSHRRRWAGAKKKPRQTSNTPPAVDHATPGLGG